MEHHVVHPKERIDLPRRRFVQGLAAGGVLAGLGIRPSISLAASLQSDVAVLQGTTFDLTIGEQAVNFTGASRTATTVNGSLPAPILRWREGDRVTLNVTNRLRETTSIHWHGIILPESMDGVPGLSSGFDGIKPGESFTYEFDVKQNGTYWYHSHSGFQEQTGLYGALIIDPREPEPFQYDRDYVVLMSDWMDEDPADVYVKLKKMAHYYNFNERTHQDLMAEIKSKGIAATWSERKMWNTMRMNDRDLADVSAYIYTYLMNGQTPAQGWQALFKPGEKVRLRFINGSAMTFFDVRIPGLKMTVVAADGQYVQPVAVDEFRIGVAETYDVIVEPQEAGAYAIFAQSIDRSGFALGNLTSDPTLRPETPKLDPVPSLSMSDMGMAHHGEHGASHQQPSTTNDHAQHNAHASHQSSVAVQPELTPLQHAKSEFGPHVDMRAEVAPYRLNDPGVGLRDNGRRVLTYADLRNLKMNHGRTPDREIEMHLTGNMHRYMWSIDGIAFADAEPLHWQLGERLRITFVNDTMMNHPMHLHGMWSELETGDAHFMPLKHTVIVQPGSRISFQVNVDAPGKWAFHCHLMYHMHGMFRTVIVSEGGEA